MMRQPSSPEALYAWWNEALRDPATVRHDGHPECGFYKMKKGKKGKRVWIAIEISCDQDTDYRGELTRDEVLIAWGDSRMHDPVAIWTHLRPISREEHDHLQYCPPISAEPPPPKEKEVKPPKPPIELLMTPTLPT